MDPRGIHYIVEASGCSDVIGEVDRMQEILVEAARKANTHVWAVSFHRFPPNGVSGVVVISESHLSVHTWPEARYLALDIYTCGMESIPEQAVSHVLERVQAEHTHISELTRGLDDDGDRIYYHSLITWEEELRKGKPKN